MTLQDKNDITGQKNDVIGHINYVTGHKKLRDNT
jgi:hypothetical protein